VHATDFSPCSICSYSGQGHELKPPVATRVKLHTRDCDTKSIISASHQGHLEGASHQLPSVPICPPHVHKHVCIGVGSPPVAGGEREAEACLGSRWVEEADGKCAPCGPIVSVAVQPLATGEEVGLLQALVSFLTVLLLTRQLLGTSRGLLGSCSTYEVLNPKHV
jgi:hypothetical protein